MYRLHQVHRPPPLQSVCQACLTPHFRPFQRTTIILRIISKLFLLVGLHLPQSLLKIYLLSVLRQSVTNTCKTVTTPLLHLPDPLNLVINHLTFPWTTMRFRTLNRLPPPVSILTASTNLLRIIITFKIRLIRAIRTFLWFMDRTTILPINLLYTVHSRNHLSIRSLASIVIGIHQWWWCQSHQTTVTNCLPISLRLWEHFLELWPVEDVCLHDNHSLLFPALPFFWSVCILSYRDLVHISITGSKPPTTCVILPSCSCRLLQICVLLVSVCISWTFFLFLSCFKLKNVDTYPTLLTAAYTSYNKLILYRAVCLGQVACATFSFFL